MKCNELFLKDLMILRRKLTLKIYLLNGIMLHTRIHTYTTDFSSLTETRATISVILQYKSYKYDHKCHVLRKLFHVTQTRYIIRTA